MKKLSVLSWVLLAVTAALAVISYIFLPETVITQFSAGSSAVTVMPKFVALIIPTALGAGGASFALIGEKDDRVRGKSLLVSAVGIIVFIIMLAVNL